MLCKLPVDEAEDVVELVDHVLGSGADANLLKGLCELLESISESAGVVKVREAILVEEERVFGAGKAGVALFDLGNAYGDLGDPAKQRDMLERALAIEERAYGRDHTSVAATLTNLGNAYGDLGDPAKQRDMLEGDNSKKRELLQRVLPILTRAYGTDHPQTRLCQSALDELASS